MSAEDQVAYWKRRTYAAEAQVGWARDEAESLRRWMTDTFTEERRLHDRITHLYSMLRAHGFTAEQIDGPLPDDVKFALELVEVPASGTWAKRQALVDEGLLP